MNHYHCTPWGDFLQCGTIWAGKNHRVVYMFGDVVMHHKQENFEGVFFVLPFSAVITRFRSLVEVVFCWLQFLRSVLLIRFVYMKGLVYYAQATIFQYFNSKLSKCDNLSKIHGHWWIKPSFILISRISKDHNAHTSLKSLTSPVCIFRRSKHPLAV